MTWGWGFFKTSDLLQWNKLISSSQFSKSCSTQIKPLNDPLSRDAPPINPLLGPVRNRAIKHDSSCEEEGIVAKMCHLQCEPLLLLWGLQTGQRLNGV